MKFEEKLQKLRKEKGLSQEQLAEQLGVTRQSVSKWESGQSYPEMDKLLLICKIFDCSLDELTNDNIDVENINVKSPIQKGTKYINNFLNDVNKAIDKFKSMSNSEIKRCLIELLVVVIILSIIHAPLADVLHVGYFNRYDVINSVWNVIASIIDFAYFIFSLFVIFYVFKTRYLDVKQTQTIVKEKSSITKSKKAEVIEDKVVEKDHNPWKMLVVGFLKFILVCIAFPIMMSVFGLIVAFFVILFLTIDGINLVGPLLIILSLIIAFSSLSSIFWNIIFSIKKNYKKIFVSFIVFSVFFSVGTMFSTMEVSKYTYYDAIPNDVTKSITSKEIIFNSNYHLSSDLKYDSDVIYTINNQMLDTIIVRVTYYPTYTNPVINVNGNRIDVNTIGNEIKFGSQIYQDIKEDLVQHRIYNYAELYKVSVDIIGNETNINQLKYNN